MFFTLSRELQSDFSLHKITFGSSLGAQRVLCAIGTEEGLTTVFGQLKGAEQEKVSHTHYNRGNRSEKRDLKFYVYTHPERASKTDTDGL